MSTRTADTESLDDLEAKRAAPKAKGTGKAARGLRWGQRALLMFILFLIYTFLHSNIFLDSVGALWTGASDANGLTDKGIYITGLLCVLLASVAYALVEHDLL